ncbi:MAG: hypothetical protein ACPG80_03120 [Rickettsiales bacterium]
MQPRKQEEGFTLIIVAALLIVAAMAAATVLQKNKRDEYWNPRVSTHMKLDDIADLLVAYQRENQELPCAAGMDDTPGDTDFGKEAGTCDNAPVCSAIPGTNSEKVGGTQCVRIGMLPVRELGLPDTAAVDQYGNRILYAVTEVLTDPLTFSTGVGAITVEDEHANPDLTPATIEAAFIIIAPGKNKNGAVSFKGGTTSACSGSFIDSENCYAANATFVKVPFNGDPTSSSFFDDQVVWMPVDKAAQLP